MKRAVILSVSAMAMLATLQQAFARDDLLMKPSNKLNVAVPQRIHTPVLSHRATDTINKAQSGGLTGVGVPGGVRSADKGAGILRRTGAPSDSIMPKGTTGAAKERIGSLKDSMTGAKGVQAKDGATAREALAMKKALDQSNANPGKVVGVQAKEGATAKQTQIMKQAIETAKGSRGNPVGVSKPDSGAKLTPEQKKALKEEIVNPAVNHDQKDKDKETAKHLFDFATKNPSKPGFDWSKYEPKVPKPPKPNG